MTLRPRRRPAERSPRSSLSKIALASGWDGRELLARAEALAGQFGTGSDSELGRCLAKLRRAVEAFEAGQQERLFRGHLVEDLTEGQSRWLIETGQLAASAGKFAAGEERERSERSERNANPRSVDRSRGPEKELPLPENSGNGSP